MDQPFNILDFIPHNTTDAYVLIKLFFLLGIFFYLIFAGVIIRQTDMMLKSLNGLLDLPVRYFAWFHFLIAIGVLIMAIILL